MGMSERLGKAQCYSSAYDRCSINPFADCVLVSFGWLCRCGSLACVLWPGVLELTKSRQNSHNLSAIYICIHTHVHLRMHIHSHIQIHSHHTRTHSRVLYPRMGMH